MATSPPSSTNGRHRRWAASILSVAALAVSTTSFPIPSSVSMIRIVSSIPSRRRVKNAGSVGGGVGVVHLHSSSSNQQNNESTNNNESINSISGNVSNNNNNNNNSRRSRRKPRLPDKNLYSILGASPTMSRPQIKRLYLSLAKETHPDSSTSTPTTIDDNETDRFNEIARAWTVLSDPKTRRAYDRELAAQDFKADVVSKASEMAREYGPSARKFYDDFAIPFLRRTTATTLAGWSALEKEVGSGGGNYDGSGNDDGSEVGAGGTMKEVDGGGSNNQLVGVTLSEVVKEVSEMERRKTGGGQRSLTSSSASSGGDALEDFGKAFQRVFEAGRNVTRQIDGMEMQEKSLELRARADETKAKSTEVLERLTEIKTKRLRLTFQTSSANFTSEDALQYLNGFDNDDDDNDNDGSSMPNIDSVTLMQRMAFKNPIGRDIKALNIAESDFDKRNAAKTEVDRTVDDRRRALDRAERDLRAATEAEERATRMLEDARGRVADSRQDVVEAKESIRDMYTTAKVADRELSRAGAALRKRRDAVRRQMKHNKRKADADAEKARNNAKGEGGVSMFDLAETGKVRLNPDFDKSSMNEMGFERQTVETIRELQREEDAVEAEYARLVGEASRLVSQSETMRLRSDKLIGEQREQQRETMASGNAQATNDPQGANGGVLGDTSQVP